MWEDDRVGNVKVTGGVRFEHINFFGDKLKFVEHAMRKKSRIQKAEAMCASDNDLEGM